MNMERVLIYIGKLKEKGYKWGEEEVKNEEGKKNEGKNEGKMRDKERVLGKWNKGRREKEEKKLKWKKEVR